MPAQALYRKWRPQQWEEVVGQDHVVQTLRNALRLDRTAHAYLFAGPRGCGKTTTARLVAKALNCLHPDPARRPDNTCPHCLAVNEGRFLDLIEIDGASNNSVENIRDLRDKINFAPSEGRYKIYIIDEVHMLSLGAFNALLKTLEEPPAHAVFILATTESHKIPPTVASRCQRFEFRRIPVVEMVSALQARCAGEGLSAEPAALELVARQATGSLRDAISLLDQLVTADRTVTLAEAEALLGTSASQTVRDLVDALALGDTAAALTLVNRAVDAGVDARQLARQVVEHLRHIMLAQMGNLALVEASPEEKAVLARQAQSLDMPALLKAVRVFNAAANDLRGGWQPQLPLELAVVECTSSPASGASVPATAGPAAPPAAPAPRPVAGQPTAAPTVPPIAAKARPAAVHPAEAPAAPSAAAAARPTAVPPAEAQPVVPPSAPASVDLRASWERLKNQMREKDKATQALLNSCSVAGLDGSALKLTTHVKLAYDKINDNAATRRLVEDLWSEIVGFPCSVQCTFTGGQGAPARNAKTRDRAPDGPVVNALRDLGGEIVED